MKLSRKTTYRYKSFQFRLPVIKTSRCSEWTTGFIKKIDVFGYPTVVWRPLSMEPLGTSAQTLCYQNIESLGYIFDCMGLSSFKFSWWAPKDACVLKQVIQGRWFWHQSKARMRISYWSSIVTLVLSCPVSEILQVTWEERLHPIPPEF